MSVPPPAQRADDVSNRAPRGGGAVDAGHRTEIFVEVTVEKRAPHRPGRLQAADHRRELGDQERIADTGARPSHRARAVEHVHPHLAPHDDPRLRAGDLFHVPSCEQTTGREIEEHGARITDDGVSEIVGVDGGNEHELRRRMTDLGENALLLHDPHRRQRAPDLEAPIDGDGRT